MVTRVLWLYLVLHTSLNARGLTPPAAVAAGGGGGGVYAADMHQ